MSNLENAPTYDQQIISLKRTLHDGELLQGGATYDSLGRLSITSAQEDRLHAQMPGPELTAPHQEEVAHTNLSAGENDSMSHEKIKELVESSFYTVECCARVGGQTIFGRSPQGLEVLATAGETVARIGNIPPAANEIFDERGVGEALGKIPLKDAPYTVLSYSVVPGAERIFRDYHGRPGNIFKFNLVLPNEKVEEVWNSLQSDPAAARDIARTMIETEGKGVVSSRKEAMSFNQILGEDIPFPPYEEWQAVNGSNAMAFWEPGDSPRTCKTVEFTA